MTISVGRSTEDDGQDDVLELGFGDEWLTVRPPSEPTFGRGADVDLGDNPHLHRVTGRFVRRHGVWWLQNCATHTPMTLTTAAGSRVHVAPNSEAPLGFDSYTLTVVFASQPYVIECRLPGAAEMSPVTTFDGNQTIPLPIVKLTDNQRLLLVALCLPRLTGGNEVPATKTAASLLGWPTSTFNRRLDRLCAKFDRAGVNGLVGDTAGRADDRRRVLVDHALSYGIITVNDLALLPK